MKKDEFRSGSPAANRQSLHGGSYGIMKKAIENGSRIENVVIDHHGNPGGLAVAGYPNNVGGIWWAMVSATDVNNYAQGKTVTGDYSKVKTAYLRDLYLISTTISQKGNLIFTACEAGLSEGLAASIYNLIDNSEINVLLNNDWSTAPQTDLGRGQNFGTTPSISRNRGSLGWTIANKYAPSSTSVTGDIQFNKTGDAVTFIGALNDAINR